MFSPGRKPSFSSPHEQPGAYDGFRCSRRHRQHQALLQLRGSSLPEFLPTSPVFIARRAWAVAEALEATIVVWVRGPADTLVVHCSIQQVCLRSVHRNDNIKLSSTTYHRLRPSEFPKLRPPSHVPTFLTGVFCNELFPLRFRLDHPPVFLQLR